MLIWCSWQHVIVKTKQWLHYATAFNEEVKLWVENCQDWSLVYMTLKAQTQQNIMGQNKMSKREPACFIWFFSIFVNACCTLWQNFNGGRRKETGKMFLWKSLKSCQLPPVHQSIKEWSTCQRSFYCQVSFVPALPLPLLWHTPPRQTSF